MSHRRISATLVTGVLVASSLLIGLPVLLAAPASAADIPVTSGDHDGPDTLRQAVAAANALSGEDLIVIDPISAYLGSVDSHENSKVRGVLGPLSELAGRLRIAVVGVTHLNKSGGSKAMYRSSGSLAFVAAARAAWSFSKDPENPDRRLMRLPRQGLGLAEEDLAIGAGAFEQRCIQETLDQRIDLLPRAQTQPLG